jgi:hypothetical protein
VKFLMQALLKWIGEVAIRERIARDWVEPAAIVRKF